jgi:hypothetical protein
VTLVIDVMGGTGLSVSTETYSTTDPHPGPVRTLHDSVNTSSPSCICSRCVSAPGFACPYPKSKPWGPSGAQTTKGSESPTDQLGIVKSYQSDDPSL